MLLFAPVSAQEKFDLLNDKVLIEQLSVELLFAWAAVIETLPVASRYTTKFLALDVGMIVSDTRTYQRGWAVLFE